MNEDYWVPHFDGPFEWTRTVIRGGCSETECHMTVETKARLTVSDEAWRAWDAERVDPVTLWFQKNEGNVAILIVAALFALGVFAAVTGR